MGCQGVWRNSYGSWDSSGVVAMVVVFVEVRQSSQEAHNLIRMIFMDLNCIYGLADTKLYSRSFGK
jgi:hypothetical protein